MPKRKRPYQSNTQADVLETLVHSKKLLQRALKLAKGFERQKLGKRLKLAESKGEDVSRINREIAVWKGLELSEVSENYLYARILKVKRFAESGLLPEEVLRGKKEKEGLGEEERTALNNVTSGMCNMKCVKEAMEEVLRGLYLVMRIPLPEELGKGKGSKEEKVPKGILKGAKKIEDPNQKEEEFDEGGEPVWDGFESGGEESPEMDSEDLSRYDALLGSSDSGSSDEDDDRGAQLSTRRPSRPTKRLSLSLSPSPSASPPPPTKRPKTKNKPAPAPTKSTTFLPSLLGGYYSGSESSVASDIENTAPPIRKNRPGQMARRAIAEKKFGEKAKHIKSGQPKVAEMWKKARDAKDKGKDTGRNRRAPPTFSRGTGDNAIEVGEKRNRGVGRKDDVGVLHPSWQAAKAAKEAKKSATFRGKKVTFD
jgi:hypothetical protein